MSSGSYYQPRQDLTNGDWCACYPTPGVDGSWTPLVSGLPNQERALEECRRLNAQLVQSNRALREERRLAGVRL